jgi:hypothetical protein
LSFRLHNLDDGEVSVEELIANVENPNHRSQANLSLKMVKSQKIIQKARLQASAKGTPDYSDLLLDKYISVIEIVNPMHRMWSDAAGINSRWRTDAIGKCTFCDISQIISKFTNLLLLVCFVTVWSK